MSYSKSVFYTAWTIFNKITKPHFNFFFEAPMKNLKKVDNSDRLSSMKLRMKIRTAKKGPLNERKWHYGLFFCTTIFYLAGCLHFEQRKKSSPRSHENSLFTKPDSQDMESNDTQGTINESETLYQFKNTVHLKFQIEKGSTLGHYKIIVQTKASLSNPYLRVQNQTLSMIKSPLIELDFPHSENIQFVLYNMNTLEELEPVETVQIKMPTDYLVSMEEMNLKNSVLPSGFRLILKDGMRFSEVPRYWLLEAAQKFHFLCEENDCRPSKDFL